MRQYILYICVHTIFLVCLIFVPFYNLFYFLLYILCVFVFFEFSRPHRRCCSTICALHFVVVFFIILFILSFFFSCLFHSHCFSKLLIHTYRCVFAECEYIFYIYIVFAVSFLSCCFCILPFLELSRQYLVF